MLLFSNRHSRARGNPGWVTVELAWIPAFAGMTEKAPVAAVKQSMICTIFSEGDTHCEIIFKFSSVLSAVKSFALLWFKVFEARANLVMSVQTISPQREFTAETRSYFFLVRA
jgi:hypothetical protein